MIKVYLENSSYVKGTKIPLTVEYAEGHKYQNIQIEIFDTAVRNPTSKLGFGTTPEKIDENTLKAEIDTSNLACGVYEIKLVRFHSFEDEDNLDQVDFVSARDFERILFEVLEQNQDSLSTDELYKGIYEQEANIEKDFLKPHDIRLSPDLPSQQLCVLVYIKPKSCKHYTQ